MFWDVNVIPMWSMKCKIEIVSGWDGLCIIFVSKSAKDHDGWKKRGDELGE